MLPDPPGSTSAATGPRVLMHLQVRGASRLVILADWSAVVTDVLMHLQVRGASRHTDMDARCCCFLVLMHLQVRGASRHPPSARHHHRWPHVLMHLQVRGASRHNVLSALADAEKVLMHLQVRGASRHNVLSALADAEKVLMHLQVRGASRPWLWNRRHDATSGARSATGPASTPRDRPTPGADYHISLQSRQAPPTTPTPPPANSFRRHHAEKPRSKQGPKSRLLPWLTMDTPARRCHTKGAPPGCFRMAPEGVSPGGAESS